MKRISNPTRILALALGAVLCLGLPAAAREGFGTFSKTTATLYRVEPPAVFLAGTRIGVKVTSAEPRDKPLAERLRSQLESELLSRDPRLTSAPNNPQTLIEVEILQNDSSTREEVREMTELKQVGRDAKGKAVYDNVPVNVRFTIIHCALSLAYKVSDTDKEASLDADSIQVPVEREYREGQTVPPLFALQSESLGQVIERIARRLTPTKEKVGVLLPRGSLEDLATLAQAGQWNRYLEALEGRNPSAEANAEAYRQYALGTAYEALGYAADDPGVTLKYLEQADSYYNKAIDANPGEKFFTKAYDAIFSSKQATAPLERVRTALVAYRRIKDFQESSASLQATPAGASSNAKSLGAPAAPKSIGNADVIRMVKAGLPDDVIVTAIAAAPAQAFDVSPSGLIDLSQAQVSKHLIAHIQQLAAGKPAASQPQAKKKPAPPAKRPPGTRG